MRRKDRLLIVDDDAGIRRALRRFLQASNFEVGEAGSIAEAEPVSTAFTPDLALVDLRLPDGDGIELIPRLRFALPQLGVVVLTAHGSIDAAVRAMKQGADQFLTKPVDMEALLLVLGRVLEDRRNRQKQAARGRGPTPIDPFLGVSPAMRLLADEARQACATDRPVLILGETGTGKGVLARWLHEASPRSNEPFVDLNCAGISRDLLDAELFGHDVGAFTGAVKAKQGLLEVAHKGTVFLDEIGDMDPAIQARLLKVLEEKRFRRLGDVKDRIVDVRLIAATHQDLARLMEAGRFRSDLYYRIAALELRLPPLRERRDDLAPLAAEILEAFAREIGRPVPEITEPALGVLRSHPWPGNVRELRNVLETAVLRCAGRALQPDDLRLRPPTNSDATTDLRTLADVERIHIERVLGSHNGHVANAARSLGVSTSSLYERLKRMGIDPAGRGGRRDPLQDESAGGSHT